MSVQGEPVASAAEVAALLAALRTFEGVPRDAIEALCLLAPPMTCAPGEVVLRQGGPSDVALLVVQGLLVAFVQVGPERREVGRVRPGEIVGEVALATPGAPRSASVFAREPTTCLRLSASAAAAAAPNPAWAAVERHLLASLASRIRHTNHSIHQAWRLDRPLPVSAPATLRQRLRQLLGGTT